MGPREHSTRRHRPSGCGPIGLSCGLAVALSSLVGCSGAGRSPAAATNESFDSGGITGPQDVDDRWASIVLDDDQRSEVRTILAETAEDPGSIRPLVPAPHGVRFEDIPRAILNAAPRVEMAVMRGDHLDPSITLDIRDSAGRAASILVRCRPRGGLATMTYRIPGDDVVEERGEILLAVNRVLVARDDRTDPSRFVEPLTHALAEHGATVIDHAILPERYRYTLLMLDEQEAVLELRREPPPTVVSWTATAGTFPRPEIAQRLGETFMECLRAWGEVPSVAATASADE